MTESQIKYRSDYMAFHASIHSTDPAYQMLVEDAERIAKLEHQLSENRKEMANKIALDDIMFQASQSIIEDLKQEIFAHKKEVVQAVTAEKEAIVQYLIDQGTIGVNYDNEQVYYITDDDITNIRKKEVRL